MIGVELAGFRHVETMCTLFKKTVGQTPGQYRRENPSFAKKSVPQVLGK